MGGYTGINDIIQKITVDRQFDTMWWTKQLTTPVSTQNETTWFSYWTGAGFPTAGSAPAAGGTTYINGDGGITFPDRSPSTKYLLTFGATSGLAMPVALADRLVGKGSLFLSSATTLTINTPALPRYSGGDGVQAWLEVTTAGTAATVRLNSYTNQDGVAGRVGGSFTLPAITNTTNALLGPLPLQLGDRGIQSVQGLQITSTGTTGCSLILCKWITPGITCFAGTYNERDFALSPPKFPIIYDGATLMPIGLQQGNALNTLHGVIQIGWI